MAELKDAFNQMTNVWKGRESEFSQLLQKLQDANSPEKAFKARRKIIEEQCQGGKDSQTSLESLPQNNKKTSLSKK